MVIEKFLKVSMKNLNLSSGITSIGEKQHEKCCKSLKNFITEDGIKYCTPRHKQEAYLQLKW